MGKTRTIAASLTLACTSVAWGQGPPVYEWVGTYPGTNSGNSNFFNNANWAGGTAPPTDGDYILRHGFAGDGSGYADYLSAFQRTGRRSSGFSAQIDGLVASGRVVLDGPFLLSGADVTGELVIPEQTYAGFYTDGFNGPSMSPSAVQVGTIDGELDFSSSALTTPGPLDVSSGELSLRGIPIAIEEDTVVAATFDGDLTLGQWRLAGFPIYNPGVNERLDVGGTLDLTEANVTGGVGYYVEAVLPDDEVPAYFTIASYDNRLGALPQSELLFQIESWSTPSGAGDNVYRSGLGQIVYTSGENAGPGEIRVLTPEPATLGLGAIAAGVLLVRRR